MTISIHFRHCERIGLLLGLCAVVSGASAGQPSTESSKAAHRTVRESQAIAPWLVSSDEGLRIIGAALESRHTDANADCSTLVHEVYERAGFTYSYANSSELYRGTKEFRRVIHPQPGDVVVWPGHVGIVISPVQHSFFSAMRSGRGVEFYDSAYWQARGRPRFFRHLKTASPTHLSASTRNAKLRSSNSRNSEPHSPGAADEDFGATSGISSAQQAAGTSMPGSNGDGSPSSGIRADTTAPAEVSSANSLAALSAVDGSDGASVDNSESQTAAGTQSAMDQNKERPTRHKIQSPGDGVWEKTATKPSAGIPFGSAGTPYLPGPQRGSEALNIPAMAGHTDAKPRSAGKPPVNESRAKPTQWAMSRYVPRPPWSSSSGRTVPGQSPGRIPRAPGFYLPTWQAR